MLRPCIAVWLLSGIGYCLPAPAQAVTESKVRAAVLLQLANYVEWPADAFRGAQEPVQFCVLAGERLAPLLSEAARGRSVNGRRVTVRNLSRPEDSRGCHVLFVGYTRERQLSDTLQALRSLPTLTVGEADAFVVCGGIINLTWEEGSVRFEINQDAAAQSGLRLSSRLLRLARLHGKGS